MKTAVLEHVGDAVRFNDELLDFAKHIGFKPVACNVRSGWEKARVERATRYIRESFFEARTFEDLDDLNQQLRDWLKTEAIAPPWQDDSLLTMRDALAQESLQQCKREGSPRWGFLKQVHRGVPFVSGVSREPPVSNVRDRS